MVSVEGAALAQSCVSPKNIWLKNMMKENMIEN